MYESGHQSRHKTHPYDTVFIQNMSSIKLKKFNMCCSTSEEGKVQICMFQTHLGHLLVLKRLYVNASIETVHYFLKHTYIQIDSSNCIKL